MEPILMAWSGGKDSAMALHRLKSGGQYEITALLTTVNRLRDRISMHGVRRELLQSQAAALRLPLHCVEIPEPCDNATYEAAMTESLQQYYDAGIRRVAFGDLFLEDIRKYRENQLQRIGMEALFPVWGEDTRRLAGEFITLEFGAVLVCVDTRVLSADWSGRRYDRALLRELPPNVDPCGENGEFHTFVHAGPLFDRPLDVRVGDTVVREGFAYADLMPDDTPVIDSR